MTRKIWTASTYDSKGEFMRTYYFDTRKKCQQFIDEFLWYNYDCSVRAGFEKI